MQEALKKQLSTEERRLDEDLKQKKKVLQDIENERENTGAELYDLQQKLVKLQKNIENNQVTMGEVEQEKAGYQKRLKEIENGMSIVNKENTEGDVSYQRRLDELSQQNLDFQKIYNFLCDLKNEGKIKRREVFKSEESLSIQERQKDRQDYLISSLTDEKKRLLVVKDELKERLGFKYSEKEELGRLLTETITEVEKVTLTKRNVLINLRKSLIDLGEKTKSLDIVNDLLRAEKEKLLVAQSALAGTKNQKKAIYSTHSHYETILHKLQASIKVLSQEKENLSLKKERALSKLHVITSALNSTENEVMIFTAKQETIRDSIANTVKAIMKLHAEVQKTCTDILKKANEHKTESKLQRTLKMKFATAELKIQEIDQDTEMLENELARLRLDILNTEVLLGGLTNSCAATQKEKEEREKTVSLVESEIKENHDIHEKKMLEVAKYNNEYHKIRQKLSTNTRAPTEALFFSNREQLIKLRRDRKDVEGEFIRLQSANIEKEIALSKIIEELNAMKKKENVVTHRQKRLITEQKTEDKDIKGITLSIKASEYELAKLNEFCTQFTQKNTNIGEKATNYISEFKEKLKILESEAAKFEIEIDRLKDKKANILQEIMEAEQQGLLWERKIELEKEMQATLNPDVGQTEIVKLQKEHHLLSLELLRIKKEQDVFSIEVEKTIHKRDFIASKYLHKENSLPNLAQNGTSNATSIPAISGGLNSAARSSLLHSIEALKGAILTAQKNLGTLNKKISITTSNLAEFNFVRTRMSLDAETLKVSLDSEKEKLFLCKLQKVVLILEVFYHQQGALALEKIIKKGKAGKAASNAIDVCNKVTCELERVYVVILECINKTENMSVIQKVVRKIYHIIPSSA